MLIPVFAPTAPNTRRPATNMLRVCVAAMNSLGPKLCIRSRRSGSSTASAASARVNQRRSRSFCSFQIGNSSVTAKGNTSTSVHTAAPDGCRFTQRDDRLYLHIYNWPFQHLHIDGLAGKVAYAQFLHDASEVQWIGPRNDPHFVPPVGATTLTLELPVKKPSVVVPVVELILK